MTPSTSAICVIIAARDAAATIQRAVRSALRETRVAEIVVVDDGSTDATAEMALAADDGSGRLRVLMLDSNRGPAFARNHAIAHSQAPLIAILDADDFFLKGRFDRLVDTDDWDFVADNIVFIDARSADLARTRRAGLRRASRASSTCRASSKAISRGAARRAARSAS